MFNLQACHTNKRTRPYKHCLDLLVLEYSLNEHPVDPLLRPVNSFSNKN